MLGACSTCHGVTGIHDMRFHACERTSSNYPSERLGLRPCGIRHCRVGSTPTTPPTSSPSAAASGTPSATAAPTSTASPTVAATAGWVVYHSTVNHVSFLHPTSWHPCEFNGVVTVVDNPATACPTHTEGPAGTVTITIDAGRLNYSGSGV